MPDSGSTGFSLVIAAKDRAEKLGRCLESINPEDMAATGSELIVVDNNSEDDSCGVVRAFKQKARFPVTLLKEPRTGLSFCRNTGIQQARSATIIFTDDDCYLAPDYLRAARRTFEDEAVSFATGRVLLHDKADSPIMICTDKTFRPIDSKSLAGIPKIIGANLIIRKAVFEKTGLFDPDFGSGSPFAGDDIELICRALAKGFTGVYDPALKVFHHHGRQEKAAVEQQELYYAKGVGALFCKRILHQDASALNALLLATSRAHTFRLWAADQDDYKDAMRQGARLYLAKQVRPG